MNDGGDFISTQWWQLQILTDVRNFDLMSAALISLQVSGIANLPDDRGLVAFVPEQQLHSHWCDQLTTLLEQWHLAPDQYQLTIKPQAPVNWGKQWRPYYHAVQITHFMKIVPAWQTEQTIGPYDILLDPKESFGTGIHPTTRLCLQLLEQVVGQQQTMIDVGTGTGILAIAARKLGIKQILGVDIDTAAVTVARENYDRNCHDKAFTVRQNSLLAGIKDKADLITANLLEDPVRQLVPSLANHLTATGQVIISGILASRIQLLAQALPSQFTVQQIITTQEWGALLAQKQEK